jgi:hypothetical protein
MKFGRTTGVLLVTGCVSLIAAAFVGVSDNPPGIALCYLGVTLIVLAIVHRWRSAKKFLLLMGGSLIGGLLSVLLHNFLYALAQLSVEYAVLRYPLEFLHGLFFIIAVLVSPPAILIGALGSIVLCIWGSTSGETA